MFYYAVKTEFNVALGIGKVMSVVRAQKKKKILCLTSVSRLLSCAFSALHCIERLWLGPALDLHEGTVLVAW